MAQAEVRRIVNTVGETNQPDREEVVYQLGAVIDGGWVPFLTKSEGYTQHLSQNNQETQADETTTSDASATTDQPQQSGNGESTQA